MPLVTPFISLRATVSPFGRRPAAQGVSCSGGGSFSLRPRPPPSLCSSALCHRCLLVPPLPPLIAAVFPVSHSFSLLPPPPLSPCVAFLPFLTHVFPTAPPRWLWGSAMPSSIERRTIITSALGRSTVTTAPSPSGKFCEKDSQEFVTHVSVRNSSPFCLHRLRGTLPQDFEVTYVAVHCNLNRKGRVHRTLRLSKRCGPSAFALVLINLWVSHS